MQELNWDQGYSNKALLKKLRQKDNKENLNKKSLRRYHNLYKIPYSLCRRTLYIIKDYPNGKDILKLLGTTRGGDRRSKDFQNQPFVSWYTNNPIKDIVDHILAQARDKGYPLDKICTPAYPIHHIVNWAHFNFNKPTRDEIIKEVHKFNSLCNLELVSRKEHNLIHIQDYRALHNHPSFPIRNKVKEVALELGIDIKVG